MKPIPLMGGTGLLLASLLFAPAPLEATSVRHRTVVDLIDLAEIILAGEVVDVSDGVSGGVPYTEVTVSVDEVMRGEVGAIYRFRQYGLTAPRSLPNGLRHVAVSPDGWPRFQAGERVLLFLYQAGSRTGLRTTVGLSQGTFHEIDGGYVNGIDNHALFRGLTVEPGLLQPAEEGLFHRSSGPLPAAAFRSFVRNAVQERWVETRRVAHAH